MANKKKVAPVSGRSDSASGELVMSERSDMQRVASLIGADTRGSNDELLTLGVQEMNRGALCVARAGCYFATLKERLPEGEFVSSIEARGFDRRRVWESMQIAQWLGTQDEERVKVFAQLPSTKALALARADQAVVQDLLDEHGGDVAALSVRELRNQIGKLTASNVGLELRLERVEAERDKIKARALNRLVDSQLPEFCVVVREEAAALTESITIAMDGLERLFSDTLIAAHDDVPDAERFEHMAAGTFFHALRGAWSRAGALLETLDQHYPAACEKAHFDAQLKPGEVDAFKHAREQVLARIKLAADNRAAERHNSKRGRGRPRSIKAVR
jgi:hypothetical protein